MLSSLLSACDSCHQLCQPQPLLVQSLIDSLVILSSHHRLWSLNEKHTHCHYLKTFYSKIIRLVTFIFLPTLPFTIPIISVPWVHQVLMALDPPIWCLSAPFYLRLHSCPAYTAVAHNFSHFSANILTPVLFFLLSYHVIDFNSVRTLIYIGAYCALHKCILQMEGNPSSVQRFWGSSSRL